MSQIVLMLAKGSAVGILVRNIQMTQERVMIRSRGRIQSRLGMLKKCLVDKYTAVT